MKIKDRIKELRRIKASELKPNPKNWRTHPKQQQDILKGILAEVGYVDALLARELSDGTLELIDGHLRAETTPDCEVPVLILDVNEDEAKTILATFDPITSIAETDQEIINQLISDIETENENIIDFLQSLKSIEDEYIPEPVEINTKPYSKAHVLLTVDIHDIEKFSEIKMKADELEIEYVTSGN